VLVEAGRVGSAASGRNGGFCQSSLTHGIGNGLAHFPQEIELLERLGRENFAAIAETITSYGIDCGFEETGVLDVATRPHEVAGLAEACAAAAALHHDVTLLDEDEVRSRIHSPTYLGGLLTSSGSALVHPARLAAGLAEAAVASGATIYEHSPAQRIATDGAGLLITTPYGRLRAKRVALCTNAWTGLLPRLSAFIVPVYDYVLATEPLNPTQRAAIGWAGREGVADSGNQFHYYRLSEDNRIVFGGYDAIYHPHNAISPLYEQRPETFLLLATHLFATFPQLEDVRFSHSWGGVIDTCTRFAPFFGTAYRGRLAYGLGYTGLGVGATRFGATVLLDLLWHRSSPATRSRLVQTKPLPFPPEPARRAVIALTRQAMAAADANDGRRNLWLGLLDRLGVGFDS